MDLYTTFYNGLSKLAQNLKVPRHVAFVMDGNRRYARNRNQKSSAGHQAGYGALREVLGFCYNSGVKEVSVFAFSIENFKRSDEEVAHLMEIADERIRQIIDHNDLAHQYGVKIKIIGDRTLLPLSLQKTIANAEDLTKHNSAVRLNICMPYTARDDITHSIRRIIDTKVKDIDESTIQNHLYTNESYPLDLLIRTSDTKRLSDYLLWEINDSTDIQFVDTLWPEFTPWKLFKCFCYYGLRVKH